MINNQSFQQSVKPSSYKKDLIPKPYRMVAQFQEFLNITTLSQIKKYQGKLKRQLNNTGTGMLRKFKYLSLKDQFLISMRASTYVVVIEHEVQNEKEREKYGILIYQKFWLKVYQMQTKCRLKKKLKQNKEKLLIQKSLIQGEKKEQKIPFLNKLWNLFTGQADKKQQEELKKVSKVSLEQRVTEDEQELENLLPKS